MSLYRFIACDHDLPELFSDRKTLHNGDVRQCVNSFEDSSGLEILRPINEYYDDISYYTSKKHIYSLECRSADEHYVQLLRYLENINSDVLEIEIWSISLCDFYRLEDEILLKLEKSKRVYCPMNKLTIDILKKSIECDNYPYVLIIK